ncbi:hypothetical protein FEM48_Zijuj06G0206500 [Ziziphus jujuba var. spinosa]|uniref:Uncharacterized protein n=1 Tax=Ziziphus jujuba var. spinosa TaxID=714518 RepID=A0A978VBH8_ZIZJJ|nr:hypothetical protein FEM48_Zijuj06G0206500 [Ziziphus jujuba var. spinosa]
MASKPGILSDWPWKPLGCFKISSQPDLDHPFSLPNHQRALHHHFLYSRHHSHHHSSIVIEPITSVIHPFAEHLAYFVLFAIPMLTTLFTGTASIASHVGYVTYIDFMNNMRHCNFELVPNWIFSIFPPLKYLMYNPS